VPRCRGFFVSGCVLPVVSLYLLWLIFPFAALAATLKGVVLSETAGQRVSHATMLLCDEGGNVIQDQTSSDSGEFVFAGVRPGPYVLKVQASGYEPADVRVDLNFATEKGISVYLRPARTTVKADSKEATISAHALNMPEGARKQFTAGMKKLYGEKDANAAAQDFLAAIQQAPNYYEAWYQMGMAQIALKNGAEAEKSFKKSVDLSLQSYAQADLALALMYLGRHDTAQGEPLLRRSIELDSSSWSAFYELGKLEMYRGNLTEALGAAQKAQTLAPKEPLAYRLLSLVHLKQGNLQAAIGDLDEYIKLDPDSEMGTRAKQLRQETAEKLAKAGTAEKGGAAPQ
jgi:Flp pilus assembly protein TadD